LDESLEHEKNWLPMINTSKEVTMRSLFSDQMIKERIMDEMRRQLKNISEQKDEKPKVSKGNPMVSLQH